jgi:branched-chain amino acid transport system substrate-binding protein
MKKVAAALAGSSMPVPGGTMSIRQDNHQAEAPFYVAVLERGVKLDAEGSGAGWRTEAKFSPEDLRMPSSCRMRMPA